MSDNVPDLSGKIALVTGASRGIGRACAVALAKAGAHVLAVGRTAGALEELDDEIKAAGGHASLIPFDLTEGDGIEHMAAVLTGRFKKLDILIGNAASLGELAPLPDIDAKVWRQTLDLNLTVNWRLLRALDPMLRNCENARVLFLTSRVGGEYARAFWGAYAVSKAALEMLARTYAEESTNLGISVGVIDPGAMRTGMRAAAMPGEDPETLPAPEEIAPLLYHAMTDKAHGFQRYVFRDWKSNA
ncbi:MAG: SDR family NAD(P)-dependent oxidoreductase [Marinicaulis sp.]|nr:SDR family NAD(P)-dependent oxidoreductase [Marinicaulis sp.]NNE40135.1 SDR family NAD(P)-dependent oxidoreductase [Marinicaulis sp.]NNL87433.1 SDR family NAD(P)-dependent oxidoreductase [Marinicaulis sp.]